MRHPRPRGREDQITEENADRVHARLITEGANGPTSVEADAILRERGIPVLPDVLANAGGVTVSYFEWVQDLGRLFWGRDEIRAKLAEKMADAFDRVWNLSTGEGMSLREAALVSGIREVAARSRPRGIPCRHPLHERRDADPDTHEHVRDAMVREPLSLEVDATAQEAGEALSPAEVRAVFVLRRRPARRRRHAEDARPRGRRRAGVTRARRACATSPSRRSSRSTRSSRSRRRSGCSRSTISSGCP